MQGGYTQAGYPNSGYPPDGRGYPPPGPTNHQGSYQGSYQQPGGYQRPAYTQGQPGFQQDQYPGVSDFPFELFLPLILTVLILVLGFRICFLCYFILPTVGRLSPLGSRSLPVFVLLIFMVF